MLTTLNDPGISWNSSFSMSIKMSTYTTPYSPKNCLIILNFILNRFIFFVRLFILFYDSGLLSNCSIVTDEVRHSSSIIQKTWGIFCLLEAVYKPVAPLFGTNLCLPIQRYNKRFKRLPQLPIQPLFYNELFLINFRLQLYNID